MSATETAQTAPETGERRARRRLRVEYWPLARLLPYAANARTVVADVVAPARPRVT